MLEYISNGVRLGWLIDPFDRQVYIYRPNREIDIVSNPLSLSGEDVLPGFELDTAMIWTT
ncbi:Uma2 family endonuclease [Pirellulaceae bacterium SH449]